MSKPKRGPLPPTPARRHGGWTPPDYARARRRVPKTVLDQRQYRRNRRVQAFWGRTWEEQERVMREVAYRLRERSRRRQARRKAREGRHATTGS